MKKVPKLTIKERFGQRLASLRKARGLTQVQLGAKVGLSQRMIAYYEQQSQYIPAGYLIPLAKALHVSLDELVGLKKIKKRIKSIKR